MSAADAFIDTNVLVYLFSSESARADRAEEILNAGGVVSVQVLNEFAAVAARKLRMPLAEIREALAAVRALCTVVPLTAEAHERGLLVAERHGFSIYDAMIVASALLAGCSKLLSEDMQHGLVVDGALEISNPFR